jgi:hypothetical protein
MFYFRNRKLAEEGFSALSEDEDAEGEERDGAG